ncbi:MAG: exo-alpha-sialidase, partial [Planctomycetes bacterium]|nr:exo-alpha-sialidase [Planctomycetota bacterium]
WRATDLRLDSNTTSSFDSRKPQIAADGNSVYVVWHDARNGGSDIFLNRSLDAGTTWLPNDIRVNKGVAGITFAVDPQVAAVGTHALVVWQDRRNGSLDVFCNRTTTSGSSWSATDVRLDTTPTATTSIAPRIVLDGNLVGVVWQDHRNGTDAVYANWSLDLGATWLSSDRRLDTSAPGTTNATDPRIDIDGSSLYVAWTDDRNGAGDVYCNYSLDSGQSWAASDVRLDTDTPGSSASIAPRIVATADTAWVTWQDDRSGFSEIHANIPFGMLPYGDGTPGSGGFVPRMQGNGQATLTGIVSLDVVDALGGAPSAILIGFQPRSKISLSFLGGTLLVNPIASPQFPLFGTLDVPGAGNISIPIWLPTDPVFRGFNVNFQVVTVDAGSVFGWSMTNAVEMWIGD